MYHRHRSDRAPATRAELWVIMIVVVAVLVALAIFLLVYHDVPLRPGGSAI